MRFARLERLAHAGNVARARNALLYYLRFTMLVHLARFIPLAAALACALGVSRLAYGPLRPPLLAQLAALACFAFLPLGSLPPWSALPASGCVYLFFFALSASACRERGPLQATLLLALTLAVLSSFVYVRGLPGSHLNFATLVALPLWAVASPVQWAGLCLLALCLLACAPLTRPGLQRLAFLAVTVAALFPFNIVPHLFSASFSAVCADFLLFWCRLLIFAWITAFAAPLLLRLPRLPLFCAGAALCLVPLFLGG